MRCIPEVAIPQVRSAATRTGSTTSTTWGPSTTPKTYRACAWWLGTRASRSFKLKQVVISTRAGAISGFIPLGLGDTSGLWWGRPREASCGDPPMMKKKKCFSAQKRSYCWGKRLEHRCSSRFPTQSIYINVTEKHQDSFCLHKNSIYHFFKLNLKKSLIKKHCWGRL